LRNEREKRIVGKKGDMALKAKQAMFVLQYMVDKNAAQAAVRSGYAKGSATQLMADPEIKKEIARLIDGQKQKLIMQADEVLESLTKIARSDVRQLYTDDNTLKAIPSLSDDVAFSISEVSTKEIVDKNGNLKGYNRSVKMHSKTQALDLIGKHYKLFTEKHEHTGKDGGPIQSFELSKITTKELRELLSKDDANAA
jgi:phage terminase small subunit